MFYALQLWVVSLNLKQAFDRVSLVGESSFEEQLGGKYDACFQVTKTGGVGFDWSIKQGGKGVPGPLQHGHRVLAEAAVRGAERTTMGPRAQNWTGNVGDGEQDHARDLRRQLQLPGWHSTGPADHD